MLHRLLPLASVLTFTSAGLSAPFQAPDRIDPSTVVSTPHGTFGGVAYLRYEAMFEGATSNGRHYRVPCQIITPSIPGTGSGLLVFDWLVDSTISTAVRQEQADARYTMGDAFHFGRGSSYATVRCSKAGIGKRSPTRDPFRPWSDGLLDTSSEFIASAGDEFDIVVDYVNALRTDPIARLLLGSMRRTAAFGYSASGFRLRGLLRLSMGKGLFDFSIVGGAGNGYSHPTGNDIGFSQAEKPPLSGAGLELDLQSETDVLLLDGWKTRHEEANYRVYQFAGTSHLRDVDAAEFGLRDPQDANPADWAPFLRALFAAGDAWCDGITPPPSLWLGAANRAPIARDANGNALVSFVGGLPVSSAFYRLPEVAVGENRYIPFDASYEDGTFLGFFRTLAGSHVDLTGRFSSHAAYVQEITLHALDLQARGYLLEVDAHAIILQAVQSSIGS